MGQGLSKDEIAAMRAPRRHAPHFGGHKPSPKAIALASTSGMAIETGLFWADKREPELQVTYRRTGDAI